MRGTESIQSPDSNNTQSKLSAPARISIGIMMSCQQTRSRCAPMSKLHQFTPENAWSLSPVCSGTIVSRPHVTIPLECCHGCFNTSAIDYDDDDDDDTGARLMMGMMGMLRESERCASTGKSCWSLQSRTLCFSRYVLRNPEYLNAPPACSP